MKPPKYNVPELDFNEVHNNVIPIIRYSMMNCYLIIAKSKSYVKFYKCNVFVTSVYKLKHTQDTNILSQECYYYKKILLKIHKC